MLYIKLFIEQEKNIGQSAPECPFKSQISDSLLPDRQRPTLSRAACWKYDEHMHLRMMSHSFPHETMSIFCCSIISLSCCLTSCTFRTRQHTNATTHVLHNKYICKTTYYQTYHVNTRIHAQLKRTSITTSIQVYFTFFIDLM